MSDRAPNFDGIALRPALWLLSVALPVLLARIVRGAVRGVHRDVSGWWRDVRYFWTQHVRRRSIDEAAERMLREMGVSREHP